MSFNIGQGFTKFVKVNNPEIRPKFSDKVVFAELITSDVTKKPKINKDTGDALTDNKGKVIFKREYFSWKGRFVGNAFEPAKYLKSGDKINIISGNIKSDPHKSNLHNSCVVNIFDFDIVKNS